MVSFMTRRTADLVHFHQQRVGVTVVVDAFQFLDVAAFLALSPQPTAAAAPVADTPGAQRLVVGVLVHVRQHQDNAGFVVLGDDWY